MLKTSITKTCSHCKQIKSLSEFYKNRSTKDGFQSFCKPCWMVYEQRPNRKIAKRIDRKRYKKTKQGKIVAKRYQQSNKGKAVMTKAVERYRVSNPEKCKARSVIQIAVRARRLPKPDSMQCSCGEQAEQYHHQKGYVCKHWYDVIAVCMFCHRKIHSQ